MNILYGINATGNGHISRSRITISELKKRGHNVTVLFSGRKPEDFFDVDEFKPFVIKKGFTFIFKKGRLDIFRTLINVNLIQFVRDIFDIKKEYDIVLTDFEPISAYAARRLGIHCIGIGHQYSFLKKIPKSLRMKIAGLFFLRFYTPINSTISSHFHHFNQPILPPFIENQFRNNKPLTVVRPGKQTRRFTHVEDTVKICLEAWKKNKCRHYSISNKESYSVLNVARMFKSKIKFLPKRPGERYSSALTDMNLSNKVYKRFGKIRLKEYIENVLID